MDVTKSFRAWIVLVVFPVLVGVLAPPLAAQRVAPGPLVLQLLSRADDKPLPGVMLRVGGRSATTDLQGLAVFDGLPAGATAVVVAQAGYDRLQQPLVVPAGARDKVVLHVTPEQLVAWSGSVRASGSTQPIAAARLALRPIEVPSASPAVFDLQSGYDGRFAILEMPVGRYACTVECAGFAPVQHELLVDAQQVPFDVELQPVAEPVPFVVRVRGAGGAPIAGAKLTIAEAFPLGVLGEATTDAAGRAEFRLRAGRANWQDEQGRCAIGRQQVHVRAEAEGHHPRYVVRALADRSECQVELWPIAGIDAREPNETPATAQEIQPGVPVTYRIDKSGDQDCFRFRLVENADVAVEVAAKAPLHLHATVHAADGRVLLDSVCNPNERFVLRGAFRSGTYVVRIEHWGNHATAEAPGVLTVHADYAADPCEPNDALLGGRRILAGQEVRGYVHPVGDVDHFRFEVARSGLVRFAIAPWALHPHLAVLDEQGRLLAERVGNPGQPLELRLQLAVGRYVVRYGQWGNGASSLQPYSFRCELLADDGIDDPAPVAGAMTAVRTLAVDAAVANTILPVGDIDRYSVCVPNAGVLSVHARSPFHPMVRLYDQRGRLLGESVGNPGQRIGFQTHFDGPQQVVLEFRCWGDGACDSNPYVVGTSFASADEVDAMVRDDEPATATPARLGDVLRGSIAPLRDVDHARIEVDHPGVLHVRGTIPQVYPMLRVLDPTGRTLAEAVGNPGQVVGLALPVLPGDFFVQVRCWGDNGHSFVPYAFEVRLERADPREGVPLGDDPVRPLRVDEAGLCRIEQAGDRDRFVVDVPAKGTYVLKRRLAVHPLTRLYDDRTGQKLGEWVGSPQRDEDLRIDAPGPMRYRIEQFCWGNAASFEPGYVGLFTPGRVLLGERLVATVEPTDPTRAVFTRVALDGYPVAASCRVDADGDGRADFDLPFGEAREHRYGAEGLFAARAELSAADGTRSESLLWVEAMGPLERTGVHLFVSHPGEGAVVDRAAPVRVSPLSYSGTKIARVTAALDGAPLPAAYSAPWTFELPWTTLGPGEHELAVTAIDARGAQANLRRRFRLGDYFDLQPADGAQVSGNRIVVAWNGRGFGPGGVRYRAQGTEAWTEVPGQNGRDHRVPLDGCEPGRPYEVQPFGAAAAGPVRIVTRVAGLAFGQGRYAATIARDYDQRLGISVRNQADRALSVRLECGKPDPATGLLVGFVGEGSEDRPIALQSGEEREFLLGLSAQDAMVRQVRFPLRIVADGGLRDEVEADITIRLPKVDLQWEDLGALPEGIGRRLRLHNRGDGLTDLRAWSTDKGLGLSPQVEHGLLPAGASLDFVARPSLHEGFSALRAVVKARAIDTTVDHEVAVSLAPGERIHRVPLLAGGAAAQPADDGPITAADVMTARAMSGAFLDASYVDWSKRRQPEDTDGDGKADRWTIVDELEGIRWVGDDTDGDGAVDFVHGDIGDDGQFDYSAWKTREGWEPTNLVEAHLEMGFALPWHRSSYEKHDLDLVVGGKVIGKLRDVVPEGNYTFRLPPDVLPFDDAGAAGTGEIEIRSQHLRGGHYVVSSDFRVKTRMLSTQVFVAAASPQAAAAQVLATPDLTLDAPDYSVSSHDVRVEGDLRAGAPIELVVPVRNVGAGRTANLAVALRSGAPGQEGVELKRVHVAEVPLVGSVDVRLPWTAAAGVHSLQVVVDPDHQSGDTNPGNDVAIVPVTVPGEDQPPTLAFTAPAADFAATDTLVEVAVTAADDSAVERLELRVDGGLWTDLRRTGDGAFAGRCVLQPGAHTLVARATDSGGRQTEATLQGSVQVPVPSVTLQAPTPGLAVHEPRVLVRAAVDPAAVYVAARAGNGPWTQLAVQDGVASGEIDVPFGQQQVEVAASDARGARGTATVTVQGLHQPVAEPPAGAPGATGAGAGANRAPAGTGPATAPPPPPKLDVDGHPYDPTGPASAVLPPAAGGETSSGGAPAAAGGASATPEDPAASGSAPAAEAAEPSAFEAGAAPATDLQPEALPPPQPEPEPAKDPATPPNPGNQPPAAPTPAPAPAAAAASRPPGAFVAAQSRTQDWYCTNRPQIAVKFRLPEWLKKKNLNYANKAEYERMVKKFLDDMKRRGFDTSRLEQFQALLKKRIGRMDQPGELPGWLESLGLGGPKPTNPAELAAWRDRMQQAADAWYLRLLASGDPALIAKGLQARADAIGQFDKAMQEHAEAAIEMVHAHQKLAEDCIETLPVVGDVLDVYAAVTGEAALSGDRLSALERALRAASVLGPLGLEQLLKRSPTAQLVAEGLGEMAQSMGRSGKDLLARALKMDGKAVDKGLDAFVDILTKERRLLGESADDAAARAAKEFAKSPAGIADANRMLRDHADARDLVNALKKADPGSDEMTRLCRELQSNKTAQALINRADVPDAVRKNVNDQIGGWYKSADASTSDAIGKLIKEPLDEGKLVRLADDLGISPADADNFRRKMHELAKKNGCSVQDLQVDTMTITNVRKPKPGDMQVSVGRDRDVTFVVKGPDGKVLSDIDHAISKGPYEQGFWKASGKGDLPTGPAGTIDHGAVSKHADQLDQCVTSKQHLEAYNTGEVQLKDFLDKSKTPPLTRIEDVKATVAYKSEHWFHKAAQCGDPSLAARHTAEGMRQATKQYDDLILSRVRQYGLDPKINVPAKLQTSMDIFKQVSSGKISPAKAEHMLQALGLSKDKVVKNMADYLEAVEKTAGVGYRRIQGAVLVNQLQRVPSPGSQAWADASLQLVNDALGKGHISGPQFLKLRADTMASVVQTARKQAGGGPGATALLRQWAAQALQRRLISAAEKEAIERQ